jgi:hypothetical protein
MPEYTFVLIPCADTRPIEEKSANTLGGLEDDSVQRVAKAHFSSGAVDGEARIKAVQDQVRSGKADPSILSSQMMQSLRDMGASVEIIALALPHVRAKIWFGLINT